MPRSAGPGLTAIAAAAQNAQWCELVCRAHGVAAAREGDLWFTRAPAPPLYPDAVTLRPGVPAALIADVLADRPVCSVKDSFADLSPGRYGFAELFDAQWVTHDGADRATEWIAVRTAAQLIRWVQACGEAAALTPELLAEPSVRILGRYDGSRWVAGAIAHRSGEVVGLSTVFPPEAWDQACTAAAAQFPGLPVVGYESGPALTSALAAGCTTLGPLRIWRRG